MSDRRPLIAIDLVPIQPGRGGAGGGIWSYAAHLVRAIDALAPDDLDIVCLARREHDLRLNALRTVSVSDSLRSTAARLRWVHAGLPHWCRRHGAAVLHKLATEVPGLLPRTRLVTTVHDFMPQYFRERLVARDARAAALGGTLHHHYFAYAARRCFARSDVVITDSRAVADEARRRFPESRARIVPIALGVDQPRDLTEHGGRTERGDGLRLLCVATFSPHKGQLRVISALDALARRSPSVAEHVSLTFRGFATDPDYEREVRAAALGSTLGERIAFTPWHRDADPSRIYAGADLLLLLSEYEGFGLPLLEAQASGVPVLCTDLPVFREILGDSARYVPLGDDAAAAAALDALLTDAKLRGMLIRRGYENARRFTWERTARETLAVYRGTATGAALPAHASRSYLAAR